MKRTIAWRKILNIVALGLALIILGMFVGGILKYHWDSQNLNIAVTTGAGKDKPNNPGGAVVSEGCENGMKLLSSRLTRSEYDEYGVSALVETAYTLTAKVTPEDAADKAVDWSIDFVNPSSTWSVGKKVEDYVTVTPTSNGALTAVVENVAAFGEQIVVKATSRDNADAFATCTVEYLQRIEGSKFQLDRKEFNSEIGVSVQTYQLNFNPMNPGTVMAVVTPIYSTVYTRALPGGSGYYKMKPTEEFKTAITNAGLIASDIKEYSGSSGQVNVFLNNAWGSALYGNDSVKKNKLINAISNFNGNAYEIKTYEKSGGVELNTFYFKLDASIILGQKGVENLVIDDTEIVF